MIIQKLKKKKTLLVSVIPARNHVRDRIAQRNVLTLETLLSIFLEVKALLESGRRLVSRKIHALMQVQSAEMLLHQPLYRIKLLRKSLLKLINSNTKTSYR